MARLRPRAAAADRAGCSWVLRSLMSFFRDGHLLIVDAPVDTAGRQARRAALPRVNWNESAARSALAARRTRAPLEGIWDGPGFRVAILPDSSPVGVGRLLAVVLRDDSARYAPGDVRGTFEQVDGQWRATVWDSDYLPRTSPVELSRDALMRMAPAIWRRVWPSVPDAGLDTIDVRRPTIRYLSSGAAVLSIVSFSPEYREPLQRVIDREWARLSGAPSVIIDLRGNEGGSSLTAAPLLPLLWSEAGIASDSAAGVVIASARNIDFWARTSWAPRGLVERLRAQRAGALVQFSDTPSPAPPRPERIAPPQQRIAIVIDRFTVSAAEQVVLWAREYGRARLYGEATGGAIDYQSTLLTRVACPQMGQVLSYPLIATSARLPTAGYNRLGIEPDVLIPLDSGDVFARIGGR